MKKKSLKKTLAVIAIVAAANPNGFTFNVKRGEIQNTGYAVALSATQNSFGAEGFLKVVEYALKNNIDCVGGWLDQLTGRFYFDATVIVDEKEKAIELGKANNQIAIFNLYTKNEIRL